MAWSLPFLFPAIMVPGSSYLTDRLSRRGGAQDTLQAWPVFVVLLAFEANQASCFLFLFSENPDYRCVACCRALFFLPDDSSLCLCRLLVHSPVNEQGFGSLVEGKGGLEVLSICSSRYLQTMRKYRVLGIWGLGEDTASRG